MDAKRYQEVQNAFLKIRVLPEQERQRELAELNDRQLADEVAALLEHDLAETQLLQKRPPESREVCETNSGSSSGHADTMDSSATHRSQSPDKARSIGHYTLHEILGRGGFGTVYRAQQHSPIVREVAIKRINPGMDSVALLRRFEAERQTLALLNHPGIASVFDAGTTETGEPYFVMELVDGIPIDRFCETTPLEMNEVVSLVVQAAEAIHHAHLRGILHRDLKPSNILVFRSDDGQPQVKVIDFGISKALRTTSALDQPEVSSQSETHDFNDQASPQSDELTLQGQLLGTLEYMSPEQLSMDSSELDTRTDIYSLGALLYRLILGRPPVRRKELLSGGVSKLHRTLVETTIPRPQPAANDDWTEDLGWVVMKAIDKDRENRYPTMHAFLTDLLRYQSHQPVAAHPPSLVYQSRMWLAQHRGVVAAALSLLAALVIGTAGTYSGWRNALVARDAAMEQFRRAETINTELESSLYRGQIESAWQAIIDGDGILAEERLRETSAPLRGIEFDLIRAKVRNEAELVIPAGGPSSHDLDWSSKTNRLVRVLDDGSVVVCDESGDEQWRYRGKLRAVSACWSGEDVLIGCHQGQVLRLGPDGRIRNRSSWSPRGAVYDIEPVGTSLSGSSQRFAACFGDSGVVLIDGNDFRIIRQWQAPVRLKQIQANPAGDLLIGCGYDDRLHRFTMESDRSTEVVTQDGHDLNDGTECWTWLDNGTGIVVGRTHWRKLDVSPLETGNSWVREISRQPLPKNSVGVAVRQTPGGPFLIGTSDGYLLRGDLRQTNADDETKTSLRFRSAVRSIASTDSGNVAFVALADGSVRKIVIPDCFVSWKLAGNTQRPDVLFTKGVGLRNEDRVATLDVEGRLMIWDGRMETLLTEQAVHDGPGWQIAVADDWIATVGDDQRLTCWQYPELELIWEQEIGWGVRDACYLPQQDLLAAAPPTDWNAREGTLALYDASGIARAKLEGHSNWVLRMVASEAGSTLVTAGEDREILVWDLESKTIVRRLVSPKHSAAEELCLVENGSGPMVLFSGHRDGTVLKWNLSNGKLEQTLSAFGNRISGLQTIGNRLMVASSSSPNIKFFDLSDGKLIADLPFSDQAIELLRASEPFKRLWVGNSATVQIHDLATP